MVYKPLAAKVALVAGLRQALPVCKDIVAVEAVGLWESCKDFQRVGKGGKPALWLSMLSTLCQFHGLLLPTDSHYFSLSDMAMRRKLRSIQGD
jgi:hypothetical protein